MKRLFYCKEELQFYWVIDRPKSILIEWHEYKSGDVLLDYGVMHKKLIVTKKPIVGGHPIKEQTETSLLIYPFQAGTPFYLELATLDDIKTNIEACDKWGVGDNYYKDLKQYVVVEKKEKKEMKAYLVTVEITTRVIAEESEDETIAQNAAMEKIELSAPEYLIPENITKIRLDEECPIGTFDEDDK